MRFRYGVMFLLILLVAGTFTVVLWLSQQPLSNSVHWLGASVGVRSGAHDVSADGTVVVGYVELQGGVFQPVFWQKRGNRWQMHNIPLPNEMQGVAFGVSPSGDHIVGSAMKPTDGTRYGFLWSRTTGIRLLAPSEVTYLTKSARWARGLWEGAYDVDNEGHMIVGMMGKDWIGYWQAQGVSYERRRLPHGENLWVQGYTNTVSPCNTLIGGQLFYRPAIWQRTRSGWKLTPLVQRNDADQSNSPAAEVAGITRIGDRVIAVGTQSDPLTNFRAIRWVYKSGKWHTQPVCNWQSQARGVSRDGSVVVGRIRYLQGAYDTAAFCWSEARGFVNLNELYDRDLRPWLAFSALSRWFTHKNSVLIDATAVTEDGRHVVGRGYNARTEREEAYIARLQ